MIDLTANDANLLLKISEKLSGSLSQIEVRLSAGEELLRLLRADYLASYVWEPAKKVFEQGVSINMDPKNLARYDEYFQFRDPITPALQKQRSATPVHRVMPQGDLERTEFFNDFLARDGLHHGINLYAYDGNLNIGDLRIWRNKRQPEFDGRDVQLLNLVKPHFKNALRNARVRLALQKGAESTTRHYWENSPIPCFVFDRELSLFFRNQASMRLEKQMPERQFSQLMSQVSRAAGGKLPEDGWGPFQISVFRPEPSGDEKRHLVVHVQRAAQPRLHAAWLRSRFGLSQRESQIAMLLVKGLADKEVAGILSITFNTVRAHIKSIFHKLEVTNRTELLHTMMHDLVDITLD
ncbi:MAG: LuxR C-terminal-related transcriptional regulator [Desulfarculaceae bacterium]|nr:LuxR C-terminal-related transcriptional regulator [Desulfarculaceae bacterium]